MTNSFTLLALAAGWLALPLIPALRELKHPTDGAALDVFQGNAADAREGLHDLLPLLYADDLRDWSAALAERNAQLLPAARVDTATPCTAPHLVAPAQLDLDGVPASARSVHARLLRLNSLLCTASQLSAHERAEVAPGACFQMLQAPLIVALPDAGAPVIPAFPAGPFEPVAGAKHYPVQKWWRAKGDIRIAPGSAIDGAVLVDGNLVVGAGAHITGSLKATGSVVLEDGACVRGNIVARTVNTRANVFVLGSILADDAVSLGPSTSVGAPDSAATVASRDVTLFAGARVHGGIFAHGQAHTPFPETLNGLFPV